MVVPADRASLTRTRHRQCSSPCSRVEGNGAPTHVRLTGRTPTHSVGAIDYAQQQAAAVAYHSSCRSPQTRHTRTSSAGQAILRSISVPPRHTECRYSGLVAPHWPHRCRLPLTVTSTNAAQSRVLLAPSSFSMTQHANPPGLTAGTKQQELN